MKNKMCIKLFLVIGIFFSNIFSLNAYENFTFSYLNNLRPDVADALLDDNLTLASNLLTNHFNTDHGGVGDHSTSIALGSDNLFYLTCANTVGILATISQPITTYETNNYSCNYISSWTGEWSDCTISSRWSSTGSINCNQDYIYTTPQYSTKTWSCTKRFIEGNYIDQTCNGSCPVNISKPSNITYSRAILSTIDNYGNNCKDGVYADDNRECNLKIKITGNIDGGKKILGLSGRLINNINTLNTEIKTNRIDNTGDVALNFSHVYSSGIIATGMDFYYEINGIKSLAPFFSNDGRISFQIESSPGVFDNVEIGAIKYNFLKPVVGSMSISGDYLNFGTRQEALVEASSEVNIDSFTGFVISNIKNSLAPLDEQKYIMQDIGDEIFIDQFSKKTNFTLNYKGVEKVSSTRIKSVPHISYHLNGSEVKYNLTLQNNPLDSTPLLSQNTEFEGISVLGNSKSVGRQAITSDSNFDNFANLSTSNQRMIVKKNISKLITGRSPNDDKIINGILFIEGDYTIGNEISEDIKTIVIKNGNLFINNDIKRKIGIILIRTDYSNLELANIYIKPQVAFINALIYADGGLISTGYSNGKDKVGNYEDSLDRTINLNKQLVFKGVLFTRNTVGGAIATGGYYILPGGKKVPAIQENFNEAFMYDLNYIRRGNNGYNDASWTKQYNNGDASPFVMIFESIGSNPLPGFSIIEE